MNGEALAKQLELALQAPAIFIGALIVMGGVIWALFAWAFSTRLAAKDGTIESLRTRISDYELKLDGKSPDELRGELNALRDIVVDGIGYRWKPLDRAEIDQLKNLLAGRLRTHDALQIMYISELGREMAESIGEAVRAAGQSVRVVAGGGFPPGVSVGLGTPEAFLLKEALSSVTRLGSITHVDADRTNVNLSWIAVGIKQTRD